MIELNGTNLQAIEDAILGLKSNESKNFSVTYPENYHENDLKGKTVEFHLTVNSVETFSTSSSR